MDSSTFDDQLPPQMQQEEVSQEQQQPQEEETSPVREDEAALSVASHSHLHEPQQSTSPQQQQQDQQQRTTTTTAATTASSLTVENEGDSMILMLVKKELSKTLTALNTKTLETETLRQELELVKSQVEEQNKIVSSQANNIRNQDAAVEAASPLNANAVMAVVASLSKLESSFAAAAVPTSSSLTDFLSRSESTLRENILLRERVDFLEESSRAFRTQASIWKKIAGTKQKQQQQQNSSSSSFDAISSSAIAQLTSADSIAKLRQQLSFQPETAKLKQVCSQVTSLLEERAAVSASEGEWKGVVHSLRDALATVVDECESSLKQIALLKAALSRSSGYCLEATNLAHDANSVAADASIKSQFISGMLASKGIENHHQQQQQLSVPNQQNENVTSHQLQQDILFYRALVSSLVGTAATASTSSANASISELTFLRRLVAEYNAKCTQLEHQNKEYKQIALSCANFFSCTSSSILDETNHNGDLSSSSASSHEKLSSVLVSPSSTHHPHSQQITIARKATAMWRDAALELLKLATDLTEKSVTRPFSQGQTPSSSSLTVPVLSSRCSALEQQVSLQSTYIRSLQQQLHQLSQLASASSMWLPTVIEAFMTDEGGVSSSAVHADSSHTTTTATTSTNESNQTRQRRLQLVADDLMTLVDTVRESATSHERSFNESTSSLRSLYEQQIQELENWFHSRFDSQRARNNALVQMLKLSDRVVKEITGETSNSFDERVYDKFLAPMKYSLIGNDTTQQQQQQSRKKNLDFITSAFDQQQQQLTKKNLTAAASASSSNTSSVPATALQAQIEKMTQTVDKASRDFATRRNQLDKRLHIYSNRDDMQLQRQVIQLQEEATARAQHFDDEKSALTQRIASLEATIQESRDDWDSLKQELETLRQDYENVQGSYEELRSERAAQYQFLQQMAERNRLINSDEQNGDVDDDQFPDGNNDDEHQLEVDGGEDAALRGDDDEEIDDERQVEHENHVDDEHNIEQHQQQQTLHEDKAEITPARSSGGNNNAGNNKKFVVEEIEVDDDDEDDDGNNVNDSHQEEEEEQQEQPQNNQHQQQEPEEEAHEMANENEAENTDAEENNHHNDENDNGNSGSDGNPFSSSLF